MIKGKLEKIFRTIHVLGNVKIVRDYSVLLMFLDSKMNCNVISILSLEFIESTRALNSKKSYIICIFLIYD
jgi:hypothetical protein